MNQVIMITGASAGIGSALAKEFHQRGYRVACLARRKDRLDQICRELNRIRPDSALAFECDVTQPESLRQTIDQTLSFYGRLDGFVANAGFGISGPVDSLTTGDYRRQFETNVYSVIEGFHAVKTELIKTQGFFSAIGSVNSYLSLPTASAYAMSKFAVRALMESLYWEMKPLGVSVTLACPGFVKTEIRRVNNQGQFREKAKEPVPEWLMMDAETAARQIASACLKKKKEVVITFHGKILVWLTRHFPCFLNPIMKRAVKARGKWNDH